MINPEELQFKLVFVGKSFVGKTCLTKYLCNQDFDINYFPTIAGEHLQSTFLIDNHDIKLEIWDTSGNEDYFPLMPLYIRGSHAVIIIFDVTDDNSFKGVQKFFEMIKEINDSVIIILVENKTDLDAERKVSKEEAAKDALVMNLQYFEISVKNKDGVDDLFTYVITKIYNKKILKQS